MEIKHDRIVHQTDEAVLFEFDGDQHWIPLSLIESYDNDSVDIPDWYAEQEELEEYEI